MKIALHKDIVNLKKYIEDLQSWHYEIQEHISKKKNECVFQGTYLFNLILLNLFIRNALQYS